MTLFASLATLLAVGLPYYSSPIARRVRDPWHAWLKPSGTIGQALGILALSLFLFLWLYPLRKKLGRRFSLGSIPRWLDVHVVAGMLVPAVAALHAGLRFEGLIGLGYLSMFVVCLSGFVGRYLYAHIPRSRQGVALSLEEVASARRTLLEEITRVAGRPLDEIHRRLQPALRRETTSNPLVLVGRMLRDDVTRRRAVRALRREIRTRAPEAFPPASLREVSRLARLEMALAQQAAMLESIQRLFRWWHAAHRPFAITALVAVLLHVGVAVFMGQTWFR